MRQISTDQMVALLDAKRGASPIGLVALTDPGMNKSSREDGERNPYYGHIVKVQRCASWINARYNKAVEKRVAKEINDALRANGDDPLDGETLTAAIDARFRKGANWQLSVIRDDGTQTPFCEHRTTRVRYLRTMFTRSVGSPVYIDTRNGDRLTYEDLAEYLPIRRDARNQGLPKAKQVRYNAWKIAGIRALRIDGETYRVRPNDEREAVEVFDAMRERLEGLEPPVPDPQGEDALPND